ncbi:MAG: hypothetical protein COA92_02955 [Sulfurovum sp.]|nr:MAG: hypothetical protein COA92_02955 [Sulfurovum sp.]
MNNTRYKQIIIEHQLLRPTSQKKYTAEDVIKKLSYIQIDSLNIVNRAHHHTLWNRVDAYEADSLNKLVYDKKYLNIGFMQLLIYLCLIINLHLLI